ncbi:MAG: GYDIA family GHMP kinase [Bacteroidales bacterium]
MKCEYFSNGKLLLTGEYLVLQGGEAIALPLKTGQYMKIDSIPDNKIIWETTYQQKKIFQGSFSADNFEIIEYTDKNIADYLKNLMVTAFSQTSISIKNGLLIQTYLDFPLHWGLGSSSTLINNLAKCLHIDPFKLNTDLTGSSGYDIACAESNKPILYHNQSGVPEYKKIDWLPFFRENIYFVYTGKKQDSKSEARSFLRKNFPLKQHINELKDINTKILQSELIEEFDVQIDRHETLLSKLLMKQKAREAILGNFPGKAKWLGAWGGDFIMLSWRKSKNELKQYLERHNLSIFFQWDEIIKS